MIQFQEKAWTDGRTEERKDGQTLFHRTLPANAGGPKKNMKKIMYQGNPKQKREYKKLNMQTILNEKENTEKKEI